MTEAATPAQQFQPNPVLQVIKFALPMAIMWYMTPDPPKPPEHTLNPWRAGRSWPWLEERWAAEQLDAAGLTYRLPGFLTEDEMEHVLSTVQRRLNFSTESSTYEMAMLGGAGLAEPSHTLRHQHAKMYKDYYQPDDVADRVLLGIERRLGEVVGIPFHDFETPLQLSHTRSPTEAREASYFPSGNLHHDLNQRGNRTASIIMYLTTEGEPWYDGLVRHEGLDGGETLFPCVRPWAPADALEAPVVSDDLRASCERITESFDRGKRFLHHPLAEELAPTNDGSWFASPPPTSHDPEAATTASDLCVASSAGAALRFAPRRGDALLFLSVHPESGEAFQQMWHAGCPVRQGHKWTLQKFKETMQTDH